MLWPPFPSLFLSFAYLEVTVGEERDASVATRDGCMFVDDIRGTISFGPDLGILLSLLFSYSIWCASLNL